MVKPRISQQRFADRWPVQQSRLDLNLIRLVTPGGQHSLQWGYRWRGGEVGDLAIATAVVGPFVDDAEVADVMHHLMLDWCEAPLEHPSGQQPAQTAAAVRSATLHRERLAELDPRR